MVIGDRLRELRQQKNLSQGDIEKKTGLLRCYLSRVENGHTVPSVETLEKLARALEIPMYQLFYEGARPLKILKHASADPSEIAWGSNGKDARMFNQFRRLLGKVTAKDQKILFWMAQRMAGPSRAQKS